MKQNKLHNLCFAFNSKYRIILKWKTVLLIVISLTLQQIGKAEYDCIFEHLSTESGLSHGSVSAMLKDSKGFMWFATWDGINRYDGHTFKTFKPGLGENSVSASSRIERIIEDELNNIWVVTYDSKAFRLNRYSEKFEFIINDNSEFSSAKITGIIPTSIGDVWISTSNSGAYRVVTDTLTNQFKTYHYYEKSEISIPGNGIRFITEDNQNNIWINTNNGVACFEINKETKLLSQKLFSEKAKKLFQFHSLVSFTHSNTLSFFGTETGQLLEYTITTNELKEIKLKNSSAVTNLTVSNNGNLFLGTNGNGLFVYNIWTKKISKHFNHPNIEVVLKTFIDSKEILWVESSIAGISKIDINTGEYRYFEQMLDVNPDIRPVAQCGLLEDEKQTVWLTLKGGGFGYYNREKDEIEYFFNKPGDPKSKLSNHVKCFYKDASGVLWMCTYFKGIDKITFIDNKFNFNQPSPQSNLSIANEIRALMEDSSGLLWVSNKKQELFILDKNFKPIKKFDAFNGHTIGNIYTFLEDSQGNIFIGTKGEGLYKLTRKGLLDFDVKQFKHEQSNTSSISNNNIYSIIEDSQGTIWIGTYGGGVNLFHNDHFLHSENELINYPGNIGLKVRHMAEDRKGNIWIGTTDGILFLEAKGKLPKAYSFRFYNQENGKVKGMRSNDIFWIYCDKQNNIWFASLGGGLANLTNYPENNKALEFSVLTKEDGLSNDVIFTITEDDNDKLWMSTENGITSFNPQKHIFRNYNSYDGIVISGFSEAAITIREDKSICFGTNKGIYSFQPNDFNNDQKKVDIVFTGFQLFGKEISPQINTALPVSITETSYIKLKYNQNVFGLTWSGLDYKMQNKIQYEYKLEGYDNNWQYGRENNQANYTKIPPGNYQFQVRFTNPELQEISLIKAIQIEVLPPFWKSTWAYIFYLIISIVFIEIARRIITSMIRLRNKVVIEKELTNIKLNFFTNISHELRTPLSLILGPAKELKTNENLSEKGIVYSNLIEQNAQRLLRLVNQLLEFRKIQSEKMSLKLKEVDLLSFTKAVCQNFDEMAKEKSIQFSIHSSINTINVMIDEEKMESVLYNLLSNAFKFTPNKGSILVKLKTNNSEHTVIIEIIDSGIGIPKEQEESLFTVFSSHPNSNQTNYAGTGIGLALSKELVNLHKGKLTYQSNAKKGATFCVQLNTIQKTTRQVESVHENTLLSKSFLGKDEPDNSKSRKLPLILIVEDNSELRTFLRLQLNNSFLINEAEDGEKGLSLALKNQPDIILSDIMMPKMDGIELLDKIKTNFETSHIPVVLLSAKTSIESKIEGLKYGADAYLTKPFQSDQLKAQLENLLHQRLLLRESYLNQNEEPKIKLSISLTERDTIFLNQVREIIEENLANSDFKIKDIYQKVGMGRSKFSDKIKGLSGISPIDFVKNYRLSKAHKLLLTGQYNVTETSYLSGFTDAGYFSKCYKERFGINPSQVDKN